MTQKDKVDLENEIISWTNAIPEIRYDDIKCIAEYFFDKLKVQKENNINYEKKCKETMLVEQNAILQELKVLHLRMEKQTVCNDAGGNKMWNKAWRLVNEAINVIKKDKETFKW